MDFTLSGAAKFWITLLGFVAANIVVVVATDSTVAKVCTVVVGIVASLSTWLVPNKPSGQRYIDDRLDT